MNNQKFWIYLVCGIVFLLFGCVMNCRTSSKLNKPTTISNIPVKTSKDSEESRTTNHGELSSRNGLNEVTDNLFTKKFTGKASDRSVELKSPSYMESTCRQSIKKENGKALIESVFTSVNKNIKPETMAELITPDELKKLEVENCRPISSENTFSECECLLSYKVEGGQKAVLDKLAPLNK